MARLGSFGCAKLFLPSDQGPVEGDDGVGGAKHRIVFLHEPALGVEELAVGELFSRKGFQEVLSPITGHIESGVCLGPDHEVIKSHRLGPGGGIVKGDALGQVPVIVVQ